MVNRFELSIHNGGYTWKVKKFNSQYNPQVKRDTTLGNVTCKFVAKIRGED